MMDAAAETLLRDYSAGRIGTREVIARLALHDYADLLIALGQTGLALPQPIDTPALRAHRARAREILQPRLVSAG